MAEADDALDVLFRPWRSDPPRFEAADRVLFLGARAHADLALRGPASLTAVQPWRHEADTLALAGLPSTPDDRQVGEGYAAALVLPERQRESAKAWLGRALLAVRPGGQVIACSPSRAGGNRLGDDLLELTGEVTEDTKARCRVVTAVRTDTVDLELARAWAALDDTRPVVKRLVSRPGLFAWDRADDGSQCLAAALPSDLSGVVADAGAGWGWLSVDLLRRCPKVTALHAIEADARALACARTNLAGAKVPVTFHWADATVPWPVPPLDAVVTNPPFHEQGTNAPELGKAFLVAAHGALKRGGVLWLVANRHLPYEKTLWDTFGAWDVVREAGAYKVIAARRRP